jgi:CRP/FNR family transcriptional regulator, dissimilatory nitrate respiration regulator
VRGEPPRARRADAAPSPLGWLPATVRQASRERRLTPGEALFRQGDPAAAIFEVERGRVLLVRETTDGRRLTLHTARAGELFAEASLFSSVYHCDAVAAAAAVVRVYPKRHVLAAIRRDPTLAERFLALLARQVQALRSRLEQHNIRSARGRVLRHLALTADAGGRSVRLSGTLMDLAAEIGLTHEALYRTLAALERDGAIARAKGSITLRKPPAI